MVGLVMIRQPDSKPMAGMLLPMLTATTVTRLKRPLMPPMPRLASQALICCKTIIGFGSPNKQGKEDCHGAALGVDEVALTREALGWEHGPFEIPASHYAGWDGDCKWTAPGSWQEHCRAYRATPYH